MIPSISGFLNRDFQIAVPTSDTHHMKTEQLQIRGKADGKKAMEQLIYKILNTERYQYSIYSHNYGVELVDLFGEPISYVCPELKRRITEALTQDKRILDVKEFDFKTGNGKLFVTFTADTIFGDVTMEKVVFNV